MNLSIPSLQACDANKSTHCIDVRVGLVIKIRDGDQVEVAQVARSDIVAAPTRWTHCSTEQHIHNGPPAVVRPANNHKHCLDNILIGYCWQFACHRSHEDIVRPR